MNLDLGGPGPGCSALRVRRLLAGELSGAELERTQAHVAECERCAATRQEIVGEQAALQRDVPFPAFAAGIAEKLAEKEKPRRSWAPLAMAASVLIVGGAVLLRPADTETVRSKGGATAQLFVKDGSGVHALDGVVAQGAQLRLALHPGGRKYAAVLLLEPGETSEVYAGPALDGPLPQAFEWTGARDARLMVVLADEPIDRRALPDRPPGGADVIEIPLRR